MNQIIIVLNEILIIAKIKYKSKNKSIISYHWSNNPNEPPNDLTLHDPAQQPNPLTVHPVKILKKRPLTAAKAHSKKAITPAVLKANPFGLPLILPNSLLFAGLIHIYYCDQTNTSKWVIM